jgi:hypothetical protein
MSYPQQPGNWSDPSWPGQQQPYADPQSAPPASPVGYPAAGYGGYGYGAPAAPPTNSLAMAAMICSLVGFATCITAPIGAILGHVARKQIRERGEGGDGMALTGIIVGWILTALFVALIIFYVVVVVWAVSNADTDPSPYSTY